MTAVNRHVELIAIVGRHGDTKRVNAVFHAMVNESQADYASRWRDVISYVSGTLHDIKRIQAVQLWLLCTGYKLSNCIIKSVTMGKPVS
jgi:hypothetical protein